MKENELNLSAQNIPQTNSFENSDNDIHINAINNLLDNIINNLFDDIKPLPKIHCLNCRLNCICKIGQCSCTISSNCTNNHNYNSDLIDF